MLQRFTHAEGPTEMQGTVLLSRMANLIKSYFMHKISVQSIFPQSSMGLLSHQPKNQIIYLSALGPYTRIYIACTSRSEQRNTNIPMLGTDHPGKYRNLLILLIT